MESPEDLAADHEALLQFLYLAPVGIVQTRADGTISMINPLSAQLLMPLATDGDLTNLFDALEGVAPELRALVDGFEGASGTVCDGHRVQLTAGLPGREDPRFLSVSLVRLDADRLMAVLSDVTLPVRRERQLKQSEAWFNAILTGVSDYALLSLDAAGRIESWNASIGRVAGLRPADVEGQPFSVLACPGDVPVERVTDRLHEADVNGWSLEDAWYRRTDDTRFWGSTMIAPLHDPSGEVNGSTVPAGTDRRYALIVRDVTDKREAAEDLRRATVTDHLTGIANRRAFFDAAARELERWRRTPRPLSLLLIDADHFKKVNDQHGHAAGDTVLCSIARTLTATAREIDVVARLGGEEFVVLLPSTDTTGAAALAERIRIAIAATPVPANDADVRCTVSVGVSTMAVDVDGLDALIGRADAALRAAKAAGRNTVEVHGTALAPAA
jgi:diguanylate cyclase (GGDEF)-like protein/PAS domain S-box-containing protein